MPQRPIATASAVVEANATPVFVDLQLDTFNIDPVAIEDLAPLARQVAAAVGLHRVADLGRIGGGSEGNYEPKEARPEFFTDPDQARDFVRRTGVDALAVSVGNVHGFYQGEPKLDFERIKRLRQAVPVPLVLHGGSGISDDDFRRAVSLGMCKINFFTGMSQRASEKVKELLTTADHFVGFEEILSLARETVTEVVAGRMRVFGSSGKGAA